MGKMFPCELQYVPDTMISIVQITVRKTIRQAGKGAEEAKLIPDVVLLDSAEL